MNTGIECEKKTNERKKRRTESLLLSSILSFSFSFFIFFSFNIVISLTLKVFFHSLTNWKRKRIRLHWSIDKKINNAMLFLISFFWFVVASFAFVLAILFPNWAQIQTKTGNQTVQRGIFFSCELLGKNETFEHTVCLPLIQQTKSIEPHKWTYGK